MGKNVVGRNGTVTGLRVRELDASELASAVGGQASGARQPAPRTKQRVEADQVVHGGGGGGFWRWFLGN
jgi:hypothetical protein